jgi:ribosomal protein S25
MKIDTEKWVPPYVLAARLKVKLQVINNWIARGKLKVLKVEDWGVRLVDATFTPKPKQPDA